MALEVGPLKIRVTWDPDDSIALDIAVSSAALYSVRVVAVTDIGEGPFSNEVQVEVAAPGEH